MERTIRLVVVASLLLPALASAQTHRGRLEAGDSTLSSKEYYDSYYFNVLAGDSVVLDLTSSEFDPFLILLSPSGADVQNDDYEGSATRSRLDQMLDESGEWRVVVTSYKAGEVGGYELRITTVSGAASQSASGPRFESGSLGAGDDTLTSGEYYAEYELRGEAGEYVVIDLRSSDLDPYLILLTPSGEQLENDDHEGDASRSQLALSLPEAGSYRVIVTTYKPRESGSYDVRIDRGGEVAQIARLQRGALTASDDTIRSGEYADSYDFEGRPGERVRIDVSSSEFDTYLILIDPNGEHTENDDVEGLSGHSVVEADITELGTYQVIVTSYALGETGAYELAIDFEEASAPSERQRDIVRIALGETTSGRLETSDTRLGDDYYDMYVFDGEAGQNIEVEMTSSAFDTYLILVSPSDDQIENDDFEGRTDRSRIELTLRESGRYRIGVMSYQAEQTGDYQLVLRVSAGTRTVTAGPSGNLYGVFVGISDYGGRANDLDYTAEDAVRMRDALINAAGMRPADGILLTDADATVAAMSGAVESLADRMGPDDMFVFFFSGHGDRVPRGGPAASDPDALDETLELYDAALTDDEMSTLLEGLNVGTTLLVLDACFSGGFAKDLISVPGRMGLFSSEEDVTSSVAAKFQAGGYLASFLADAVGDGLADEDNNRQLSALELSQYLHERYRADVKSGGRDDYVRTGGPRLGYQHLVVDRGSIDPYAVLFTLQSSAGLPGD